MSVTGLDARAHCELCIAIAELEDALPAGVEWFVGSDVLNPPEERYEAEASARTLTEGHRPEDWTFSTDFQAMLASGPTAAEALRGLVRQLRARAA